jgi:hypothetical protein
MKKQRVSPIASFQINPDFGGGDLPKPEDANRTIAELTGKPNPTPSVAVPKTEEIEPENTQVTEIQSITNEIFKGGRPVKEVAVGRVKFTTMLQPDLVKQLKRAAIDENISVADLIEKSIKNFLNI